MNKNLFNFIMVLMALDVISDVILISSLVCEPQEDYDDGYEEEDQEENQEDDDKHPLIGRRYIPKDNSWAIDKETGIEVSGLAGKEYIIVSDPYVEDVAPIFCEEEVSRIFVDVFSTDSARKYRVLFQESSIVPEV